MLGPQDGGPPQPIVPCRTNFRSAPVHTRPSDTGARWLLFAHDCAGKDEFRLTHEVLSAMLAATRPRVSQAAAKLKAGGIIDYRRGTVRILDRARLEAVSCECYEDTRHRP